MIFRSLLGLLGLLGLLALLAVPLVASAHVTRWMATMRSQARALPNKRRPNALFEFRDASEHLLKVALVTLQEFPPRR